MMGTENGNGHDREAFNADEEVTRPNAPMPPDYPKVLIAVVSNLCCSVDALAKELNVFRTDLHADATGGKLVVTDARRADIGQALGKFGQEFIAAQDSVHPEGKKSRQRKRATAVGG